MFDDDDSFWAIVALIVIAGVLWVVYPFLVGTEPGLFGSMMIFMAFLFIIFLNFISGFSLIFTLKDGCRNILGGRRLGRVLEDCNMPSMA